jgi:adenylosuccinate synthase
VVLKYSNSINGYDLLNLTKLDVLDGLDEIKVAVKYKLGDEELEGFPGMGLSHEKGFTDKRLPLADLDLLARVVVEYVTMPGWKADISNATAYSELPEKCREYVEFIETFLDVKIGWIGVGPARHSMIMR